MASHINVHLFFAFILVSMIMSADAGRSLLQENFSRNASFSNNSTAGAVSLATSNSYTGKTNYNDVLGLVMLSLTYPWLSEENGDPCLTPKWKWIQCNSDPQPRVIALNLYSQILSGILPDFSSMDALQRIDLSYNMLTGPIPSFLGTFPHLEELNLVYNHFTGLVPDSLACNKNLNLRITGNSNLQTSTACSRADSNNSPPPPSYRNTYGSGSSYGETSSTKKNPVGVVLGGILLVSIVFRIFVGIYAYFRHKSKVAAAVAEASK